MNYKHASVLLLATLLLAGCTTRSISDSGYRHSYAWNRGDNPYYRGELTEFDILGVAPKEAATDAKIAEALAGAVLPKLQQGDKIVLIQSGALTPDNVMFEETARYFQVAPFSGVPSSEKSGLAESLRLRAAQGGYRYIVCYWGVLESAQVDREGKAVSWVPIVGGAVPDQKQQMRIRLKALLVDVRTSGWKMFTPEAHSDGSYNSRWSREAADQRLVTALKEKAYRQLVADLMK